MVTGEKGVIFLSGAATAKFLKAHNIPKLIYANASDCN